MATTVIIFGGHVLYITGAMFVAGIALDVVVLSLLFIWLRKRKRDKSKRHAEESPYWELRRTKWNFEPNSATTTASGHQRKPPTSNGAT